MQHKSFDSATKSAVAAPGQQVESSFSTGRGQAPGKQLYRNGTKGPGGHQDDHEPATRPCSKGGHQPPGLHLAEHCQEAEGGDPSHLLSAGGATSGGLGAVTGSPVPDGCGLTGASPVNAHGLEDEGTEGSV